jgi:hypothetical protein
MSKARSFLMRGCRIMIFVGNSMTALGLTALVLGILGVLDMEPFAFGISSGIRMIGSVAIAGCLLSAIGYGIADYSN